jgi:hypothetical protein
MLLIFSLEAAVFRTVLCNTELVNCVRTFTALVQEQTTAVADYLRATEDVDDGSTQN